MATKKLSHGGPDYEVGFGKPPTATQFRKGESGNSKGRPKGKRNVATALQAALNEPVTIVENGKRRSITKLEAAMKQVVNKAAAGESSAVKVLLQLLPFLDQHPEAGQPKKVDTLADLEVLANLVRRMQGPSSAISSSSSIKGKAK